MLRGLVEDTKELLCGVVDVFFFFCILYADIKVSYVAVMVI